MKKELNISSLRLFIFFYEYLLNVPYVLDTGDMEHEPLREWERKYSCVYTLHSVRETMPASPNSLGPTHTNVTTTPAFHVTEPILVNSVRMWTSGKCWAAPVHELKPPNALIQSWPGPLLLAHQKPLFLFLF